MALLAINSRGAGSFERTVGIGRPVVGQGRNEIAQPDARRVADRIGGWDETANKRRHCYVASYRRNGIGGADNLRNLIVANVHGNIQDGGYITATPTGPAYGHIEELFPFNHGSHGLGGQRALNDVMNIRLLDPPPGTLGGVNAEFQVGWTHDAE